MPHFILDCSPDLFANCERKQLLQRVNDVAQSTGLFAPANIKVRLRVFDDYLTAGSDDSFIHVFAYIMEGRTNEQKSALSIAVVGELKTMFPDVPVISLNVMDFEKASYHNRETV